MMNDNVKCTQSVLVKVQDLKKYFDVSALNVFIPRPLGN